MNTLQVLGIQSAYIYCCYVGHALGKLSGCQEQPLFKKGMHKFEYASNKGLLRSCRLN